MSECIMTATFHPTAEEPKLPNGVPSVIEGAEGNDPDEAYNALNFRIQHYGSCFGKYADVFYQPHGIFQYRYDVIHKDQVFRFDVSSK